MTFMIYLVWLSQFAIIIGRLWCLLNISIGNIFVMQLANILEFGTNVTINSLFLINFLI